MYGHSFEGLSTNLLFDAIKETRTWFWRDPVRNKWGRMNLAKARKEIVAKALSLLNIENPDVVNNIVDSYVKEKVEAVQPFPDTIETLTMLRKQNIRLALITNGASESQWQKINKFQLAPLFDFILVEGDVGFGKPDERIYKQALDQFLLQPQDVWMVGDDLVRDVKGSQNLGMKGIWVNHTHIGNFEDGSIRPDYIIHSISELI